MSDRLSPANANSFEERMARVRAINAAIAAANAVKDAPPILANIAAPSKPAKRRPQQYGGGWSDPS